MPRGYHEPKNPFTGKATEHQKNALKGKTSNLSNAEIVPTPEINEVIEHNKKLADELHTIMFDRIGGNAGYSCATEYHVGIGCINEELHCIFGSTMRCFMSQPFVMGDIRHIEEELGLIEDDVVEYQQEIKPYTFNNDEKTVKNANRVLNLLDIVDIKLTYFKIKDERDEVLVEMATKSVKLMRKIAMLIIRYPSPQYTSSEFKPFGLIRDDVKDLRNYFETEYKPKFPR